MQINRGIFRGYDIRGYVDEVVLGGKRFAPDLTPAVAGAIAKAAGSRLPVGATVVVSGDGRPSSAGLVAAVVEGYRSVGVHVVGATPSALFGGARFVPSGANNWYLIRHGLGGATQVTGSHNPPYFNGMKMSQGLNALYGDELGALADPIERDDFRGDAMRGDFREDDIVGRYMTMLSRSFPDRFRHPHRIVVDAGNGLGKVLAEILTQKGVEVDGMYLEPDGRFPNHPADPSTDEGVQELMERVRTLNAHLAPGETPWYGIATDGDADRSGLVDEGGDVVWPERLAALFYREYLRQPGHAGHCMALDVRGSNTVRDVVLAEGGRALFIPAGYPSHRAYARLTAPAVGKVPVTISAEASGHFFFPTAAFDEDGNPTEHGGRALIDDGIFSALRFVEILDAASDGKGGRKTARALLGELPTYSVSSEVRVYAPDDQKFAIVNEVRDAVLARYGDALLAPQPLHDVDGMKMQDGHSGVVVVDGIRAQFKDGGWFVIRASNTSPALTLKAEGTTPDRLVALLAVVRGLLADYPSVDLAPLVREEEKQAVR